MTRRQFLKSGLAVAAGSTFYGSVVERGAFEVTSFPVAPPPHVAPPAALRVAFMSDFHRSCTTSRAFIEEAVALCHAERPDVVLLGGDYVTDDPDLAEECAAIFAALAPPRGTFFVLGNHDHHSGAEPIRTALRRAGLEDITNASTRIADGIHLVGIDDFWTGHPDVERAFRGTDRGSRLVLSHNPRIFKRVRDRACTLICGHTHGGQVDLPLVPNPYLSAWSTYVRGWFHEGNSSLYVNRGVGTLRLPIRINCRPEITVLNLGAGPTARLAESLLEPGREPEWGPMRLPAKG